MRQRRIHRHRRGGQPVIGRDDLDDLVTLEIELQRHAYEARTLGRTSARAPGRVLSLRLARRPRSDLCLVSLRATVQVGEPMSNRHDPTQLRARFRSFGELRRRGWVLRCPDAARLPDLPRECPARGASAVAHGTGAAQRKPDGHATLTISASIANAVRQTPHPPARGSRVRHFDIGFCPPVRFFRQLRLVGNGGSVSQGEFHDF
jgi:hypothetical protein